MLINADLPRAVRRAAEVIAAGEPLNPEVIAQVEKHWGWTIRRPQTEDDPRGSEHARQQVARSMARCRARALLGRPSIRSRASGRR